MPAVPTICFEFMEDLCILVHGEPQPSNPEWDSYLVTLGQWGGRPVRKPRVLVVTDRVAPTPTQRAALNKLVKEGGRVVPTAVISHSMSVRSVVRILGWVNSGIRAFDPSELSGALTYLGVDLTKRTEVLRHIGRMRVSMSIDSGLPQPLDLSTVAQSMETLLTQRLPALREMLRKSNAAPPPRAPVPPGQR